MNGEKVEKNTEEGNSVNPFQCQPVQSQTDSPNLAEKDLEDASCSPKLKAQAQFPKGFSKFRLFDEARNPKNASKYTEFHNEKASVELKDKNQEEERNQEQSEIALENANNIPETRNEIVIPVGETHNHLIAQTEANQEYSNFQEESIPEIEIFMSKATAFLLSSALFAFWSILAIELNWEFSNIFGLALIYPIVYMLIDLCWTCPLLQGLWVETGEYFKMFDAAGFLFALAIILLKLGQVINTSVIANLLFLSVALAYLLCPKKKLSLILIRWFYTVQCLLITLKLDHFIHFKWEFILIPSWIYFAFLIANCSRSLFSLLKRIFFKGSSSQNRNITSSQKYGMIWFSCYYGLSAVYLIYLIGAVQALNSGAYTQLLRIMTYVALGISVILCVCTFQKAEKLVAFIAYYQLVESHLAQISVEDLTPTKAVSLQRETKISYFVRVSSTYFKPLHNRFFAKGQYLRAMITKSKANYSYSHRLRSDMFEMNDLKQEKAKLVVNYPEKLNRKTRSEMLSTGTTNRPRASSAHINANAKTTEENTTAIKIKEFIPEGNLNIDKQELKMLSHPDNTSRAGEEEKTCYLCFDNHADAILVSCGHGGICYGCASDLVKKKNECMQCREKVEAIYRIVPNPILNDIIKGVELCKVVVA